MVNHTGPNWSGFVKDLLIRSLCGFGVWDPNPVGEGKSVTYNEVISVRSAD